MSEPLEAHSRAETEFYLKVTPCPECGQGPWVITEEHYDEADQTLHLTGRCDECDHPLDLTFRCPGPTPQMGGLPEPVNPTDTPSRIIDVAQWLGLFYMYVERSAGSSNKSDVRRAGYLAAQCLEEALKFYGGEDLPPADAFFTEQERRNFRQFPEKFSRKHLEAMKDRLPALDYMAARLKIDAPAARRKRWWQFWKRS
ncbi:MAG: hypothetical protein ACLFVU_03045 [Phycisphaerae bacterium]